MEQIEDRTQLHEPHASKKDIYRVAIILTALTALEFLFAFTIDPGLFRVILFLLLTVLKAYYIVATFMHLKDEKVNLMLTITLPVIFVIYMVALILFEGGT